MTHPGAMVGVWKYAVALRGTLLSRITYAAARSSRRGNESASPATEIESGTGLGKTGSPKVSRMGLGRIAPKGTRTRPETLKEARKGGSVSPATEKVNAEGSGPIPNASGHRRAPMPEPTKLRRPYAMRHGHEQTRSTFAPTTCGRNGFAAWGRTRRRMPIPTSFEPIPAHSVGLRPGPSTTSSQPPARGQTSGRISPPLVTPAMPGSTTALSWGTCSGPDNTWGLNGHARIRLNDMRALIADDGEICAPVEIQKGAL